MLEEIFSGSAADLSRWNPAGLVVMALGVALAALAGRLSKGSEKRRMALKLGGMLLVMAGALVTVKLFG
ncbi:MAG: hypothetical protein IKO07_00455 [Clostridia bacterium]|nr:hypothetical protein [Clostridia bacterium]